MKNFTKKRGFFAVAAVLLAVTAMLVTMGCGNDIGDEFVLPEGKGAVKLSFNNEIARTILPDNATLATFTTFDFTFTANPGGAVAKSVTGILPGNLYDAITLDPGSYNLQVIAYIGGVAAATNNPLVPVTITPAQVTNATVVLKPYDRTIGTGNGTFKYKILSSINITNINTAVMNLTSILAGTSQSGVDIKSVWNDSLTGGTLPVKAGDYYLDFVITVKTGETITFRHIINIYQGMTSSYNFTINPGYFNAVFQLIDGDLTYQNPSDKKPSLKKTVSSVDTDLVEGAIVEVNLGDSVIISVTNQTEGGYTSYEWYTKDITSPIGTSSSLTVNTNLAPFNEKRTYLLTVVGVVTTTEKYYTFINIEVK